MFTFSQFVDALIKGHGHRYIKRIPYMTPKGRRYRYIYKVTHSHKGKQAIHEDHLDVGTKFMLHTESGKEVHGHIKSVDGDKVTYVIDDGADKGKEVTGTKAEILAMLNERHGVEEQLQEKRDQLKADIEQAKKTGTEKQVARLEAQLKRLGGEPAKEESAKEARLKRSAEVIFNATQGLMDSKERKIEQVNFELRDLRGKVERGTVDLAELDKYFADKYPEVYKEYDLSSKFRAEARRRAKIQRAKQNTQMDPKKLRDPIEVTRKLNLSEMTRANLKPFDQIITSRTVKNSLRHQTPYFSKVYADGKGNIISHDNHRIVRVRENTPSSESVLITNSEARRINKKRIDTRRSSGFGDTSESLGFYAKQYDFEANQIIDLSRVGLEDTEREHKLRELNLYNNVNITKHETSNIALRTLDKALETNKPVYTFNDGRERKQIKDKLKSYKTVANAQIKRGKTPRVIFDKVGTKIELTFADGDGGRQIIHELDNVDADFTTFAIGYEYFSDLLDIGDVTLSAPEEVGAPLSYKTNLHEAVLMPARVE